MIGAWVFPPVKCLTHLPVVCVLIHLHVVLRSKSHVVYRNISFTK